MSKSQGWLLLQTKQNKVEQTLSMFVLGLTCANGNDRAAILEYIYGALRCHAVHVNWM